jgi:hypothetical protein
VLLCPAVFTTSQKKSMLKWLEKLKGLEHAAAAGAGGGGAAAASAAAAAEAQLWSLLDLSGTSAEVMNADGDTQSVDLGVCDAALVAQLQALFAAGHALEVGLGQRRGKRAITRVMQQQ